jgi:RHS repeat-associated protein
MSRGRLSYPSLSSGLGSNLCISAPTIRENNLLSITNEYVILRFLLQIDRLFGLGDQSVPIHRGEFRSESGQYYYRARYYDPTVARFLSEDPSTTSGMENLFDYVRNNPVNLYDPMGLFQTKPKQPKPSPNSVFYICCKGGEVSVCDNNSGAYGIGAVLDCMKKHEQKHVQDITCGGANPCRGRPNGPLALPSKEAATLECAAYRQELECLNAEPNTKDLLDRRKYVQKQIANYCPAK